MPASPPPTNTPSSKSTPSGAPAATGCSPRPPGPPAATTLTLAASPTSILYGNTVQVSGRLKQTTTVTGIADETLILERRPKGTTSWTTLATVTTTGDGTLDPTQAATPQAYTEYRLRHPATPFYAGSTSRTTAVRVGVRLTARLNRTSMALSRTATISGQVTPAHHGQPIRLQHKRGRTWHTAQKKALPTSGRYDAVSVQLPPRLPACRDLVEVEPHGPHDLRHTFSTWLEDAGIPARVIDELMGHERSRRGELDGGSRIGARYRHTTPEMAVRVADAIQERLTVVVRVAEAILQVDDSGGRVF